MPLAHDARIRHCTGTHLVLAQLGCHQKCSEYNWPHVLDLQHESSAQQALHDDERVDESLIV
eukprot:scaffold249311_cov31-Tisochrysis_lutea.AAC.2